MEDRGIILGTIQGGFASVAMAFISESLSHMIPWLIVSMVVILTDLAFGVRKCLLMGEEVRFSRAVRETMGKMVTYFAFVCMVCMITVAAGIEFKFDIYSCLLVCFIELCSIISNILKPKGININIIGALRLFFKKVAHVDDISEIIEEDGDTCTKKS